LTTKEIRLTGRQIQLNTVVHWSGSEWLTALTAGLGDLNSTLVISQQSRNINTAQ